MPVPAHPQRARGARRYTAALDKTRAGSLAVPVAMAAGHQLASGQAVTLDKEGLFAFDKAVPTKAGRAQMTRLAASLVDATAIRCEGYADYAGRNWVERRLGQRRSARVCSMLASRHPGLATSRAAYGQNRPAVIGGRRLARVQNRRVVVIVTAVEAAPVAPPVVAPVLPAPVVTQAIQDCSTTTFTFHLTVPAGTPPLTGVQYRLDGGQWVTALDSAIAHTGDTWTVSNTPFPGACGGGTDMISVRGVSSAGSGLESPQVADFPV